MKAVKITFVILSAALLAAGIGTTASAFHSGGVAECGGCHSMHAPAPGGSNLLVGVDASSACLTCHEHAGDTGPSSYHISTAPADMPAGTAPLQRTPGGDFGWLKKSYTFTVRGTTTTEEGETHGHNIVAADFGYVADAVNTTAPGGTYPGNVLGCNSCHDPHGKFRRTNDTTVSNTGAPIKASGSYTAASNEPDATGAVGVFRLLAGSGYTQEGVTAAAFPGVPAAKVPSTYNRTEAATETRVAYGVKSGTGHTTWGNWCGACHGQMHSTGNYVHPVDQNLGGTVSGNYKNYVMSGTMITGGANGYTSLVPFASDAAITYTALATLATNNVAYNAGVGPAASDQVNCMSCHRAHASGWEFGLRWNMEGEFMTYNSLWPGTDTTPTVPQFARGRTGAETQAAYYDRPATLFASYQRVLCNKCHAKD